MITIKKLLAIAATLFCLTTFVSIEAQEVKKSVGGKGGSSNSGLSSFATGGLSGGGLGGLGKPATFEATYQAEQSGQRGRLSVTATIEDGYYIFSTTQPKVGPMATVIGIGSPGVALAGPFVPDRSPELTFDMQGFEGSRVEKFYKSVTWTAPITFEQQVGVSSPAIQLTIDGQVCRQGACIPLGGLSVTASFDGFYAKAVASKAPFRDPLGHVAWTVTLSERVVAPGSSTSLLITGKPDSGYHLYLLPQVKTLQHRRR